MASWPLSRKLWQQLPLYLRPVLATLPVLAVTLYLFWESRLSERLLLEAETAHQAETDVLEFESLIGARIGALRNAGRFVLANPGEEGSRRFAAFAESLLTDSPDLLAVAWLDASGHVRQAAHASSRADLFVPGFAPPELQDELARAAASRQPAAGGSFDLGGGQQGLALTVPILREGQPEGAVAGIVNLTKGIRGLYGLDDPDLWNVELRDRAGRAAFRSVAGQAPPPASARLLTERHVPVADRAWKLRLWPTPLMVATLRTAAPRRILGIGLLAGLVLAVANLLLAQRQARLGAALRESERLAVDVEATRRHLSDLVNGIEAVIWESDAEGRRLTFVNDYTRKLLGVDAAQWMDAPDTWFEHVHPDDRARVRENSQAAREPGHVYPVEYRMMAAGGGEVWVREIITVIGEDGRAAGRRGIIVDITARVRAEEAVRQSQKLESLGVLAGGIAHDFNNLLTTILGNAEMLSPFLARAHSPGQPYLEKIERTTRRLADLTRQMLAYSGRSQFSVQPLDLNALITEMTELLAVSTPKNVRVSYRLDPALPLLEGDPAQIRQVILNLLTNAAEAIGGADGAVVLRTDVCTLDTAGAESLYPEQEIGPGRYVRLEVSDDGCGMDAETLSKIFDPFFTTKFTGRGLGLAALRGIVRGHRGGIRLFSQPGEGTVFTLVFPVSGERARLAPSAGRAEPVRVETATVLLVDDEEGLRSLMAMALEDAGCTVYQAADGEEGLAQFHRHEAEIDVVVLDLTMPKMGGDEVFRRIRAEKPDARIILSSGYAEEDIHEQFAGRNLSGFIEKPFAPSELIGKIGVVLSENGAGDTPMPPLALRRT